MGNDFYQDNLSYMDKYVDNDVNRCQLLDKFTLEVLEKSITSSV